MSFEELFQPLNHLAKITVVEGVPLGMEGLVSESGVRLQSLRFDLADNAPEG
jgi:hypothetical protein